nr:probable inactive purple acid phosphatase 27 [Tanacetum cinerariifolium]
MGGSDELKFLALGDMGKAHRDASVEHNIQSGSIVVTQAMANEISTGGFMDAISNMDFDFVASGHYEKVFENTLATSDLEENVVSLMRVIS